MPSNAGVEQHEHVVVIEKDFAHEVEVAVVLTVVGKVGGEVDIEHPFVKVRVAGRDDLVERQLGGAAGEAVCVSVAAGDAVGDSVEARTYSCNQRPLASRHARTAATSRPRPPRTTPTTDHPHLESTASAAMATPLAMSLNVTLSRS